MKLPYLPETKSKTKQQTVAFAGINYSQNTRDGELAECENLSSRNFPCLSQRAGRKTVQTYTSPTAMFVKRHARYYGSQMLDVVVVVDGTTLYVDGKAVGTVKAGEKQFASINSKIAFVMTFRKKSWRTWMPIFCCTMLLSLKMLWCGR